MRKTLNIDSVRQCNRQLGVPLSHPLVSVVELGGERVSEFARIKSRLHGVMLLEHSHCDKYYGKQSCDFGAATVVFLNPGDIAELVPEDDACFNKGWLLVFNNDIIEYTSLNEHFDADYRFFGYSDHEALHTSAAEARLIVDCMKLIKNEVDHELDKFSHQLIARNIELLLDHCRRMYQRQFIVRHDSNVTLIKSVETELKVCLGQAVSPNLADVAESVGVTTDYLNDMLVHETGLSLDEFVNSLRLHIASEWIAHGEHNVKESARLLGYPTTSHFTRAFKQILGCAPSQYRHSLN